MIIMDVNLKQVMENILKVARNSRNLIIGYMATLFLSFIALMIVTRILGPEKYGVLTLCLTIVATCVAFSDLGLGMSLVYFVAKALKIYDKTQIEHIIKFVYLIKLITATAISVIIFVFAKYIGAILQISSYAWLIQIFSITIFFSSLSTIYVSVFQAYEQMNFITIRQILYQLLYFIPVGFIVWFNFEAIGFGFGVASAILFAALTIIFFKYFYVKNGEPHEEFNKKELLKYARNVYLGDIANYISTNFQIFFVGAFVSAIGVGYFNAALSALAYALMPLVVIGTAFFPAVSGLSDSNKLFNRITKYTLIIGFLAFMILIVFPDHLISVVYGTSFIKASELLVLLAPLVLVTAFGSTINALISAKGRTDITLISKIIMFMTVLATIALVKWFDGTGASLSRVLVTLLPTLFLAIWCFRNFDVKYPWKSLVSVSVITAAIVGLHLIFGNLFQGIFWIAEFFISVAMFVGGLFLFREIDEVDFKVMDSVLFFK